MTADDVRIDPAATYARARLVLEGGDPEAALALIEAARDGYAGLGQTTQALRTDLGRMHVLDDLGRHTEAARVGAALLDTLDALLAAAALDGTTAAADVLALQAAALGNLGVARGFTGDHDGALASYRRAESLWRSLGSDHDAAIEVANQGIELLALGRAHEALDRLTAAQCTFDAADDTLWRA
jgi:tetratricopeptide (TPR) repeat protein